MLKYGIGSGIIIYEVIIVIAHVVCFKMKPYANGKNKAQNLEELIQRLEILKTIPVVRSMSVELNKPGSEYAAVLTELFENQAALNVYDNHPTHLGIKDYIGVVCDHMLITDHEF